jgi:gliding motility-associated-like protein
MKILKSILFILLACVGHSQYFPNLGPNQVLPCGTQSTTLTADLTQLTPLNNPHETTNYTVSSIPYTTQTNTGGIISNMVNDAYSSVLNIGFNFCFFGQSYSQFYICSNGWISFTPQIVDPNWLNTQMNALPFNPLPNNYYINPKNCIFGVWQNWNPVSTFGGTIKYQTQGIAPNRKLIVSWVEVPLQGQLYNSPNSNDNGNFHIVLYESTNVIEVYTQSKPSYSWVTYQDKATQGIYDPTGTNIILTPGRNATVWSAYNDAYRWTPSGNEIIPSLVWYEVGNPTPIASNVSSVDVSPPLSGAYYTCHFEYTSCNGDLIQYTYPNTTPDTIFVKPANNIVENPIDIIEDIALNNTDSTLSVPEPPVNIESDQFYYIPNSFTPDGNEYNNVFYPIFSDGFVFNKFSFMIYNIWGELIYESFDPNSYWDGSCNNKVCPSGVYIYVANINNKMISGHVNLIK